MRSSRRREDFPSQTVRSEQRERINNKDNKFPTRGKTEAGV